MVPDQRERGLPRLGASPLPSPSCGQPLCMIRPTCILLPSALYVVPHKEEIGPKIAWTWVPGWRAPPTSLSVCLAEEGSQFPVFSSTYFIALQRHSTSSMYYCYNLEYEIDSPSPLLVGKVGKTREGAGEGRPSGARRRRRYNAFTTFVTAPIWLLPVVVVVAGCSGGGMLMTPAASSKCTLAAGLLLVHKHSHTRKRNTHKLCIGEIAFPPSVRPDAFRHRAHPREIHRSGTFALVLQRWACLAFLSRPRATVSATRSDW